MVISNSLLIHLPFLLPFIPFTLKVSQKRSEVGENERDEKKKKKVEKQ